ncbi:MAG: hypothetical protein EA376_04870 [Phycisphaeraceae bacterium]|nr:MAG: hypothetical protein EA376_04870 [Phycisphaeraceae bacterium]
MSLAVAADAAFLVAFRDRSLPKSAWTHRAHVRVAWLHLREAPFGVALDRLRTGIIALNESHGVANTPDDGYHETVTVAFLRLIAAAMRSDPAPDPGAGESFSAFAARHPRLLDRSLLREHYSEPRLMSREARRRFLEPDLRPLPPISKPEPG